MHPDDFECRICGRFDKPDDFRMCYRCSEQMCETCEVYEYTLCLDCYNDGYDSGYDWL